MEVFGPILVDMDIKNSYLMWIGSESYGTIEEWATEAVALGVSKRLPNVAIAKSLAEEGTAVFVAHDEGERIDCPHCQGEVECPDCRKRDQKILAAQAEIETIKAKFDDFDAEATDGPKRAVRLREEKIEALEDEISVCETCDGAAFYTAGTGGQVVLKDGDKWDFRKYVYWRNQPKKWDFRKEIADLESDLNMCEHCGGSGSTPDGKVFGVFVPDAIEYIVSGDESEKVKDMVKDMVKVEAAALASESKRRCGRRKAGGAYAVTSADGADSAKVKAVVDKLVASGALEPEATDISGSFASFTNPVSISEKRFRGIKRWTLDAEAEDAAIMATEGLE